MLLVAACLLMAFFAAMLLRELAGTHRAAAPTPQPAVSSSQPSGDDSLASIEFIGVAQQSTSSVVLNYRKINALSTHRVRPVGDCIWFATLVP